MHRLNITYYIEWCTCGCDFEAVDGKPLAVIPEEQEEEENGQVLDSNVLQS